MGSAPGPRASAVRWGRQQSAKRAPGPAGRKHRTGLRLHSFSRFSHLCPGSVPLDRSFRGCDFHFRLAQSLAMRAITADLRPGQDDLKAEVFLHLAAQLVQRFAEKFLHLAAAKADDVSVLALPAGFVIMLIAAVMHEVELVDQPAL